MSGSDSELLLELARNLTKEGWRMETREKLAAFKLPTGSNSVTQLVGYVWADAILAKFDVTEKKTRYKVEWHDEHGWLVLDRDNNRGFPFNRVATFSSLNSYPHGGGERRAKEYADFLNSKEGK